jgi:hypothetical protein
MAIAVRAVREYSSAGQALNQFELSTPACRAGDLLVMGLAQGAPCEVVAPAGWTGVALEAGPGGEGDASGESNAGITLNTFCLRTADAGDAEGRQYTWTLGDPLDVSAAVGGMVALTGADVAAPVHAVGAAGATAGGAELVVPGVTTSLPGCLLLLAAWHLTPGEVSLPAGWTSLWHPDQSGFGQGYPEQAVAWRLQSGAGPSGDATLAVTGGGLAAGQLLAIAPVPKPVGPGGGPAGDDFPVVLWQRDFSQVIRRPKGVCVRAIRYAWAADGGPSWASLHVAGPTPALWEALEWLRCPVEIYSPLCERVWWGYVNTVRLGTGELQLSAGLDGLANRVAGEYRRVTPGRPPVVERVLTDWAEDPESRAEFGTRERIVRAGSPASGEFGGVPLSGSADLAAGALRDRALAAHHLPPAEVGPDPVPGLITLYCRGWWSTLDWRYYAQPAGLVEHVIENGAQALGRDAWVQAVGQPFVYEGPEGWQAVKVALLLARSGSAADTVRVAVCRDGGGAPGMELSWASCDGAVLGLQPGWQELDLDGGGCHLEPGVTYWLTARRTGNVDGANYYRLSLDEHGREDGSGILLWEGARWYPHGPAATMPFQVLGSQDHLRQVEAILAGAGQFLTGCEAAPGLTEAGLASCQYRDGLSTGLAEIGPLLGATADGRRLLATVRPDRAVVIERAPEDGDVAYALDADGRVRDRWGSPLPPGQCVAGAWATLGDVIPANADASHYGRLSPFWVERSVYEVAARKLMLLGKRSRQPVEEPEPNLWTGWTG